MVNLDEVNILLVDDQPAKLLSYEVILADLKENLIRANSAREALEILLRKEIALILVDVCMPELDGFELAAMLRSHPRYETTAIIFISAVQLSDADRIRGYETGAVDYVPVPVIPEILRAKVRVFVDLYRKTRQLENLNRELEDRVRDRTAALEASGKRLRESEERLRLASEAAEFGSYDYHQDKGEIYWSSYLRKLVGITEDKPLSLERALQFIHPEHRHAVHQHILAYAPGSGRRELEFKLIRSDGQVRWFLDRGQTIADPRDGTKWRVVGTILDITDRKLNEEHQRVLMGELDHRVKNILSNVSGMARLSSRSAQSVRQFVESLDSRIQAMSNAHGLLRKVSWGAVNLEDLASQTLAPFRSRSGDNIRMSGQPVWIVPEYTQSLALMFHELATNAAKYGALSEPSGNVTVSWEHAKDRAGTIELSWKELGGPHQPAPRHKGFGLKFLEIAASDMGAVGRYEFQSDGLQFTLMGPLVSQQAPSKSSEVVVGDTVSLGTHYPVPKAKQGRRVLVVEDETLVAMQLQSDLEDAGHVVIGPARTVAEGLKLVDQEIDVALLDYRLGKDVSAPIAEQLLARRIPFAFATGYSDAGFASEHLRRQPRLQKPYTAEDMLRLIEHLSGGASSEAGHRAPTGAAGAQLHTSARMIFSS